MRVVAIAGSLICLMLPVAAGCSNNPYALQKQNQTLQQQQLALQQRTNELQARASALDRDNQELGTLLAQARQQAKVTEDQLVAVRDQLTSVTTQMSSVARREATDRQAGRSAAWPPRAAERARRSRPIAACQQPAGGQHSRHRSTCRRRRRAYRAADRAALPAGHFHHPTDGRRAARQRGHGDRPRLSRPDGRGRRAHQQRLRAHAPRLRQPAAFDRPGDGRVSVPRLARSNPRPADVHRGPRRQRSRWCRTPRRPARPATRGWNWWFIPKRSARVPDPLRLALPRDCALWCFRPAARRVAG